MLNTTTKMDKTFKLKPVTLDKLTGQVIKHAILDRSDKLILAESGDYFAEEFDRGAWHPCSIEDIVDANDYAVHKICGMLSPEQLAAFEEVQEAEHNLANLRHNMLKVMK